MSIWSMVCSITFENGVYDCSFYCRRWGPTVFVVKTFLGKEVPGFNNLFRTSIQDGRYHVNTKPSFFFLFRYVYPAFRVKRQNEV